MADWREGISGGLPETAVDMTLRLDNAKASPTATTANLGLIIRRTERPKSPTNKPPPSGPAVGVRYRSTSNVMRSEVEPIKRDATMIRTHRRLDAMAKPTLSLKLSTELFQAARRKARGYTRFQTMKTVPFLIAGKLNFAAINPHAA
jgi:hypothetical protein